MTMTRRFLLASGTMASAAAAIPGRWILTSQAAEIFKVVRTEQEWRKLLTAEQYVILRESATERPFTNPLLNEKRRGNFACAGCDLDVYSSTTKYDSKTGWPSFWAALDTAVGTTRDTSFGMVRTAV